jgi:hypothetical protein
VGAHEVVAYRRLKGLVQSGLLTYERRFHLRPGCYRITTQGVAVIESQLPRPTIDLRSYRHDTEVVDLWLDAWQGQYGSYREVLSERELRSHDQRADRLPHEPAYAVPLGGYGPGGRAQVHYPDVLIIRAANRRLALELELSLKSRKRLEAMLGGYAADNRIERVICRTELARIATALEETKLMLGLDGRVVVHYLDGAPAGHPGRPAPHLEAEVSR